MEPTNDILIAEDERTQAAKLSMILKHAGFSVRTAANGLEALAQINERKPNLVITDVVMPEMDGYELCSAIRSSESSADLLVILLTSQSDPTDILRALACGADNFIAKPYRPQELLARVGQLLKDSGTHADRERKGALSVTYRNQPFEIDATRSRILNFFLTSYEDLIGQREELTQARDELEAMTEHLDNLVQERTASLREEIAVRERTEEQRRLQASLIERAHDAILALDAEGRIAYWNAAAERIYGWTTADALGMPARGLLGGHDTGAWDATWEKVHETGGWTGEMEQVRTDGQIITVQSSWTAERGADGEIETILLINADMTEQKRFEREALRTQRLESIGTLAGGIAHDLNNVLNPVMMGIEIVRREVTKQATLDILDLMDQSARRGSDMVKQVLTFARGAEGEKMLIQPAHLMRELIKIGEQSFPKTISVRGHIEKNILPVLGDPTQLHQVLLNLCLNAVAAMPAGGNLQLNARNVELDDQFVMMFPESGKGTYVLLTVKDTGTGIAPEVLDRIFEPFFTTKEVGKGTGLGLSTALSIVKSYNGFIRVESEVGRGTEFFVYLPAQGEAQVDDEAPEVVVIPDGNRELILLVDDEEAIRQVTTMSLESHGYRVVTAADGTEAVVAAVQHKDDIRAVILDLMMPHMDGAATLKALERVIPHVPVLISTGFDPIQRPDFPMSGLADHPRLRKPYTTEKLLEAIAGLIENSGVPRT
jgi:two-component system, cell cycle sensor histidine kinase and response regulator CckA